VGLDAESGRRRQFIERDGCAMARGAAEGVQSAAPARRAEVSGQERAARAQHPVHLAERGWVR
jgi:hypothetical protein